MRIFALAWIGVYGLLGACTDTKTVTEEAPTPTVLTSTTAEPAGANCQYGGTHVLVGVDKNANGTLDADEVQSSFYVCAPAPATPSDPLSTVHYGTLHINTAADVAAAQSFTGVFGNLVIAPTVQLDVVLPNLAFVVGGVYDCEDFQSMPATVSLPALQVIADDLDLGCHTQTLSVPVLTQLSALYLRDQELTAFSAPALTAVPGDFNVEGTQLSTLVLLLPTRPGIDFHVSGNQNLDDCALFDQVAAFRAHGWLGKVNTNDSYFYDGADVDLNIFANHACTDATHQCPLVTVAGDSTSWRECYTNGLDFADAQAQCQAVGAGWDLAYLASYADETAVSSISAYTSYWIGYEQVGDDSAPFSWVQMPASSTFAPQAGDTTFWNTNGPSGDGQCVEVYRSSPTTEVANDLPCANTDTIRAPLCRYLAP